MKFILSIALLGYVGLATADGSTLARMDDFKLYKVQVDNAEQLKHFQELGNNLPLRYLTDIGGAGRSYDVVIDPANQDKLEDSLKFFELSFKIMIDNLQDIIEANWPLHKPSPLEWTKYHSLDDIYTWLNQLVLRHPLIVRPYILGYSYEGRPIRGIRISRKRGNKAIFIESNIHALEWISSATTTCFINNLLTSKDSRLRKLSWNYDWIYVPVVNPDGFVYTHDVQRLWRKNRKPTGFHNASGICYGTDLNRNFDYAWMINGYNMDVPCDHWYAGSAPASEPEVQALQKFVSSFGYNYIKVYLAFHSYGQFLLLPFGHTIEIFPSNYQQLLNISKGFADAARVKYGTDFKYGASALLNYPVSGSAKDWAYGIRGIPYSATIELRDRGTYGFFLPANQIQPVCDEVTDGLVGLIKAAEEQNLFH